MNRTLAVVLTVLILATTAATTAFAGQPSLPLNYLRAVAARGDADAPVLSFLMDFKVGAPTPFFRYAADGNYLVVTLPGTWVNPAKRSFPSRNAAVKSLFAAQLNESTINVKVELADGVRVDPATITTRVEGPRLFVTIPAATAAKAATPAPERAAKAKPAGPTATPSPEVVPAIPAENAATADPASAESTAKIDQDLRDLFADTNVREEALTPPPTDAVEATALATATALPATETAQDEKLARILDGPAADDKTTAPSLGASAVKMFAALCLVLGLIFLIAYGLRKAKFPGRALGVGDELIRVVGTKSIGLKRSVIVVEVAGELLVLAASGNETRMLTKIDRRGSIAADGEGEVAEDRSFVEHLDTYRRRDEPPAAVEPPSYAGSLGAIRKRLGSLKRL